MFTDTSKYVSERVEKAKFDDAKFEELMKLSVKILREAKSIQKSGFKGRETFLVPKKFVHNEVALLKKIIEEHGYRTDDLYSHIETRYGGTKMVVNRLLRPEEEVKSCSQSHAVFIFFD